MEFFERVKSVRLKGHHGKYLWADDDQQRISQKKEKLVEQAVWRVERVPNSNGIRLISCYETFLTATDDPFLLGMTGKKVVQKKLRHIDSSVEWEPVSEGFLVKLKTCHGNFLRANGSIPPWRDSVTHDLPSLIAKHQEYLLWEVENVSVPNIIPVELSDGAFGPLPPKRESHHAWIPHVHSLSSPRVSQHPKPDEGREIFYSVANEKGEAINIEDEGWSSFRFKGHSLKHLQQRLQELADIDEDIVLCARHPRSTKLFTLRLGLPPNNTSMHIVVVKASSSLARTLSYAPSM
ncbi:unnamed protein product [Calypogeia fissa]